MARRWTSAWTAPLLLILVLGALAGPAAARVHFPPFSIRDVCVDPYQTPPSVGYGHCTYNTLRQLCQIALCPEDVKQASPGGAPSNLPPTVLLP